MWAMACQMSIHALDRELGVPTASAGPWQASLGPASGASHHAYGLGGLEANLNSGGATLTRARVRVVHGRRGMPWQRWVCSAWKKVSWFPNCAIRRRCNVSVTQTCHPDLNLPSGQSKGG